MNSTYLPDPPLPEHTKRIAVQDPTTVQALGAVIKRLGEQRHSRLGHFHHTEFELVLVRLDRLADKPGFDDLNNPALAGWAIWYDARERKLDTIAYRPIPDGQEFMAVPEELR